MQARKVQGFGQSIIYAPTSNVAEGDVLVIDGMVVVATRDCPANFYGEFETAGIFDFPFHFVFEIPAGEDVFWCPTADPWVGDPGTGAAGALQALGNPAYYIGKAVHTVNDLNDSIRVVLAQAPKETLMRWQELGSITGSGRVALISDGSSASLGLDNPVFAGQELVVYLKVDGGGNRTLTASHDITQDGKDSIEFNDAGDTVRLEAIEVGANLRWRLVHNEGCTLS